MCKELVEHHGAGHELSFFPREVLEENKWLAVRYGLEGDLIDLPSHARVPAVDLARRLVDRLRPHARELGSDRELGGIESMIERGTGARRLQAVVRGIHHCDMLRGAPG